RARRRHPRDRGDPRRAGRQGRRGGRAAQNEGDLRKERGDGAGDSRRCGHFPGDAGGQEAGHRDPGGAARRRRRPPSRGADRGRHRAYGGPARMRNVCVVVGSRANYSSIKSAMRAVRDHPDLRLQLVVGASALLDRYGTVVDVIEQDGFEPDEKVFMLIEGETPGTMAKSTGLGLLELPTAFDRLEPDVVITVGDRFETMSTALAATYMNIPLAHTMGGEVSGNIDESIRHAVTKFAHIHFPSSRDAADRIIRMGEDPAAVHIVGCPRMDLVAEVLADGENGLSDLFEFGVGGSFDLDQPFLLVSQHPVTTEYGDGEQQISETPQAVQEAARPAIVLWPNADAGSEDIARGIRKLREHDDDSRLHFFKNLPTDDYIKLMA